MSNKSLILNTCFCNRVTYIAGFLPQELLGTSMYEYFHQDDISRLVDVHKATLQDSKPQNTEVNVLCGNKFNTVCLLILTI